MQFAGLAAAFQLSLKDLQSPHEQMLLNPKPLIKSFQGNSSFSLLFDALKCIFLNTHIQPRNTTNNSDSTELFLLGALKLTMPANGVLMANKYQK